ncbi:MAG: glucose-1-phosphate adenylyltransferase subunit GlgD [Oscillospiraceae bacterium]|jgi:glucose-1-phosphate adenylyltransferase|nr:glucose-1-phosphate adenylyltransferase subunit GlgD [Oscillospiraceae bacterium]
MRQNNVLGLIFSNSFDESLPELTNLRTMGSVPFGGFYRLIDFPLSCMTAAGITKVGVVTKSNYRSLMDHLSLGKPWDLARKTDGLYILPPFLGGTGIGNQNKMEGLRGALEFLEFSKEEYVVMSDCHVLCNIDYDQLLDTHRKSGADITIVCKRGRAPTLAGMRFAVDGDNRIGEVWVHTDPEYGLYSLNVYVLRKALLERLVREAVRLGRTDFANDLIRRHLASLKICAAPYGGYARTFDSLQSYYDISMELLQADTRRALFHPQRPVHTKVRDEMPTVYGLSANVKNSLVADGCRIDGEVTGSIIFRGCHVEEGAVVRNSVLMANTYISRGAKVDCVIADKGVILRPSKTLAGASNFPVYLGKGITI